MSDNQSENKVNPDSKKNEDVPVLEVQKEEIELLQAPPIIHITCGNFWHSDLPPLS